MNERRITFSPIGFMIFLLVILALIGFLSWQAGYLDQLLNLPSSGSPDPIVTNTAAPTPEAVELPTPLPTDSAPTPVPASLPEPVDPGELPGLIIFSMTEAGYSHLFAYHPENLPLTRLTYGAWDDLHPEISPDGSQIAFTSNRGGQWDIYLLNVVSGETVQFTDDLNYNGHPAWSSDGLWLAYEKLSGGNLDIYIQPTALDSGELRLTSDPAHDFEPAWQPNNTFLAFTSSRNEALDILLIDGAKAGSEQNYTHDFTQDQSKPHWSVDGTSLSWISQDNGHPTLYAVGASQPAADAFPLVQATEALPDPTGDFLLVHQQTAEHSYLSILSAADHRYIVLPTRFEGQIGEIDWGVYLLLDPLPANIQRSAEARPSSPWLSGLGPSPGALFGRQNMIDLPDIKAPHPALNALAIEPFFALKDRSAAELGWDVLSDLENILVPVSQALSPGRYNDWLYTGRAFALNPVLIDYDYMVVIKETFGPEIYWRVYLKPLDQSGSQGAPLNDFPWDFDARFTGSASAYEAGGEQMDEIPSGYWVDFTRLAIEYGWERQPALNNWQAYYQGARYNTFVITSGLTWEEAMLQIWPPEVFQDLEATPVP